MKNTLWLLATLIGCSAINAMQDFDSFDVHKERTQDIESIMSQLGNEKVANEVTVIAPAHLKGHKVQFVSPKDASFNAYIYRQGASNMKIKPLKVKIGRCTTKSPHFEMPDIHKERNKELEGLRTMLTGNNKKPGDYFTYINDNGEEVSCTYQVVR